MLILLIDESHLRINRLMYTNFGKLTSHFDNTVVGECVREVNWVDGVVEYMSDFWCNLYTGTYTFGQCELIIVLF